MSENPTTVIDAWQESGDTVRQHGYSAFRDYYDGDQGTQLTNRQRAYLQIKIGQEFNDNHCATVVDALAERLTVTGFDAGDQSIQLWEWWNANRMDGQQGITHRSAVRDGDMYAIVEWDNDNSRPCIEYEHAFDGESGIEVVYSQDKRRRIEFAVKIWETVLKWDEVRSSSGELKSRSGKLTRRANLYYPDRIEKYINYEDSGGWVHFQSKDEVWPLPLRAWDGKELGVPVFHFLNADQGYNYGTSELKRVVPIQNALNKSVIDLLAAADTTAFRIFWMIGDDPSGIQIAPGTWVYSEKPPGGEEGVAIGYFRGEDLSKLIGLVDGFVIEIARVSRTPISYFQASGQRPAEGTLKQEEVGLVARAKDRQIGFGNAWEDIMAYCRRIFNSFGAVSPGEQMDETQIISTLWADPETRNAKDHLEALQIKGELGVPSEVLWEEMGYDAAAIAKMKAIVGEERALNATMGGGLLQAFEQGFTSVGEQVAATGEAPEGTQGGENEEQS